MGYEANNDASYKARWTRLRKTLEVAQNSKNPQNFDTKTVTQVLFVMDTLETGYSEIGATKE